MGTFASSITKPITVSSSTTVTLIQVEGAPQGTRIIEWGISFNGTDSNQTPAICSIEYQDEVGSPQATVSGDAIGPGMGSVLQSETSFRVDSRSTAASLNTTIEQFHLTPVGGLYSKQYPLGREIYVPSGNYVGITALAADADIVGTAYFLIEE